MVLILYLYRVSHPKIIDQTYYPNQGAGPQRLFFWPSLEDICNTYI